MLLSVDNNPSAFFIALHFICGNEKITKRIRESVGVVLGAVENMEKSKNTYVNSIFLGEIPSFPVWKRGF
jgi:hypothetical protein